MKKIFSLKSIVDSYDYFLFDQWGVLHDGNKAFPQSIRCLEKLKSLKKKIILISNSSLLVKYSNKNLLKLGIKDKLYDYCITSGQIAYESFSKDIFTKFGNKCYPLSLSDHAIKMFNLKIVKQIKNCNFALIADIGKSKSILDYVEDLKTLLFYKIPLICTNPDFQAEEKGIFNMCGGTIAQLYEDLGGKVFRYGKPYSPIYRNIFNKLNITGKERVLAVGDSLNHDILGGKNNNIDTLWIKNGVHRLDLKDKDLLNRYFKEFTPKFFQTNLKF